jgi:serine protease
MRGLCRRAPASVVIISLVTAASVLAGGGTARASVPQENPADRATYDPYFGEQWALQALKVPAAWTRSTGAGIKIGVVDTGADLGHEDLVGKIAAGTSCVGSAGIPAACTGSAQDDQGHGTHVAGIAAADTLNGKGVASVAPGATLVVVKALGSQGSGALNDVNAGIKWAVDHGARVINLSLEADGSQVSLTPGQSLSDGVEYAWKHGAIPVIAAGNATPSLFGPGGYAGVDAVIVGATGRSGDLAWYSSPLTGAKWGVVAPGGDARGPDGTASCAGALAEGCVVSTGWFAGHASAYADDEGTSMATPEVAGVLALLLAQGLNPSQAIARVLATADRMACGTACRGMVDAAAAVGAPATIPTTTTTTPAPPTSVTTPPTPAVASGSAPAVTAPAPLPVPTTTVPTTAPRPSSRAGSVVAAPGPVGASRPDHDGAGTAVIVVAVLLLLGVSAQAMAVTVRRRR